MSPAKTRSRKDASKSWLVRAEDALAPVLGGASIEVLYQPVVELSSGSVVGYEALARGPRESGLERPEQLFEAARKEGLEVALDWAYRARAMRGALDAGLAPPRALFLNVRPDAATAPVPSWAREAMSEAIAGLRTVVDLSERALTARPAELLRRIARLREVGFSVALDDVGSDTRALGLLPFVDPDFIKIDLHLVHRRPSPEVARVMNAVNAQAERSGASLIVEGIETDDHVGSALALGAHYGQGWALGPPEPLPKELPLPAVPLSERPAHASGGQPHTPFELVSGSRPLGQASARTLTELCRHLELQAQRRGKSSVVLSSLPSAELAAEAATRHGRLADLTAFVGALLPEGRAQTPEHVHSATLEQAEPLRNEWDLAVVSPHFAAALVARDLGEDGPAEDRRFEFALTHDRDLAVHSARVLMARLLA